MRFEDAAETLRGIPWTNEEKGRVFYDLVISHKPQRILELGFAHGVSTCYFAAALEAIGQGSIDAVDLASADVSPSLEELGARLKLNDRINVFRENSSYTWFLKKKLEEQMKDGVITPAYDLCFIDGPKDWTNDGFAFLLADRLLKKGGLMMFDDYSWSYRDDEALSGVRHDRGFVFADMSEEEFEQPHIRCVFDLLVTPHPDYSNFRVIDDNIAIAEKIASSAPIKTVTLESKVSYSYRAKRVMRRLLGDKRLR